MHPGKVRSKLDSWQAMVDWGQSLEAEEVLNTFAGQRDYQ
jgi:hypothetical protein